MRVAPPQGTVTMDPQLHDTVVVTLDRTVEAPGVARRRIGELAGVLGQQRGADAVLLVSELVTNAVK
jgi:anti-sigma regulatory factor (Ser/Thr protein kinase)